MISLVLFFRKPDMTRALKFSSIIAMVILGRFASLSIWGAADLLPVYLGAIYLTWLGGARIPSRET
jgi:hypothetical protein